MKKEFIKKNYPLFVGFFVPVTIMLGYFIYRGMYPFGKSSLLTVDLGQQYVDFFAAYRDTLLHDPTKIFYSFSKAIGGEMLGEFAYYLLSPFNLIFLFFKGKTLTAGIMLVTLLKYGCSGLAMAWLLQKRNKKTRLVNSALAVTYAMMGWFVANQFNLLWLDACVFLPLIIVGFYNLMETAKPACYVLFLGFMIIINYYMAYMICIFLVLFFIWYAFDNFETPKIMLKKAAIFVGSSLLAVGVGCLTLLSTLYTLSVSKGQYMQEKISFKLEYNPIKMVSKLTMGAFNFDQLPSGQPNLFISSLALFAFGLFFFCKKIKLRSRITAFLITCFLILSMCFEQNFIIFNTADDQIGITDVNGKQHNDLSLTFFHPLRKVQQRLSDDGHQNGGNDGLRDSGRRDRPHHKSKNGGNGHVFRLCVLLGKQHINAAHDENCVAQRGNCRSQGQRRKVLLRKLLKQLPQPSRNRAEQNPAPQCDPQAFQHPRQTLRGHKGRKRKCQQSGTGGICPDGAQPEHAPKDSARAGAEQNRAQNDRDVHGCGLDHRKWNETDSGNAHDQQNTAEHSECRHVPGVHFPFFHMKLPPAAVLLMKIQRKFGSFHSGSIIAGCGGKYKKKIIFTAIQNRDIMSVSNFLFWRVPYAERKNRPSGRYRRNRRL